MTRRAGGFLAALLLISVSACSASDPVPSSRYDGYYAGSRQSDRLEACGITVLRGETSARIKDGEVRIGLFSQATPMTGTVGEDGRMRASGIWANPTGGFPGVTVLNGSVDGTTMDGTASDFRCHTDIHLRKVAPARRPPGRRTSSRKANS